MSSTSQVARAVGASKNTLLRWIADGLIPDVQRDWRGWRVWSQRDIDNAIAFKRAYHSGPIPRTRRRRASKASYARSAGQCMKQFGDAWKNRTGTGV
ncbi:MAG TPA: hypothetical protein ENH84_00205 [Phycisphaerae bacterium]|nr:hypothetical protein [Phycisphaerae bacterium]